MGENSCWLILLSARFRLGKIVQQSYEKGEIMRNAQRLVKIKGNGALAYAEKMAERMQELGEDEDRVF